MPDTQDFETKDSAAKGMAATGAGPEGRWVYLCDAAALDGMDGLRVVVDDHALAVFKVDDRFYVTDDTCTHGAASLADGLMHGCEVECPFHGGRFDVRTGAATAFPCVDDLATYQAEVRGSAVYARVNAP
jgi:nitrite reductase/ring-hydroxylating ferredoxin subunit